MPCLRGQQACKSCISVFKGFKDTRMEGKQTAPCNGNSACQGQCSTGRPSLRACKDKGTLHAKGSTLQAAWKPADCRGIDAGKVEHALKHPACRAARASKAKVRQPRPKKASFHSGSSLTLQIVMMIDEDKSSGRVEVWQCK